MNQIRNMSTNQYLEQLASQLVLSDAEKRSISRSIATLQGHLYNWRHYCSVKNHYYFGSYSRNTILPRAVDPNSDIDYMIEFDDAFRTTPQTYLNWLKDFANTYYSRSEIHQDFPTIALELNHIRFELVPAVSPWGHLGLQIPAPHSLLYLNWINTDPERLRLDEIKANQRNGYKLKQVIRLMKCWNVHNGKVFSSYELESKLTSLVYYGCTTLEDYFYHAATYLFATGLSIDKQRKLESLHSTVSKIIEYKEKGSGVLASYLLSNLVYY